MRSKQMTESEIIDVLLGQAVPDVEEQVRQARRSDAKIEAVHSFWSRLLQNVHDEKELSQRIGHNASTKVMKRIAKSDLYAVPAQEEPVIGPKLYWLNPRTRKSAMVFTVVAACVLFAAIGTGLFFTGPIDDYFSRIAPVELANTSEERPESPDVGTAIQIVQSTPVYLDPNRGIVRITEPELPHFESFQMAVAAVSPGGTIKIESSRFSVSSDETLRVTKRLRMEAVGGPVQIRRIPVQ